MTTLPTSSPPRRRRSKPGMPVGNRTKAGGGGGAAGVPEPSTVDDRDMERPPSCGATANPTLFVPVAGLPSTARARLDVSPRDYALLPDGAIRSEADFLQNKTPAMVSEGPARVGRPRPLALESRP